MQPTRHSKNMVFYQTHWLIRYIVNEVIFPYVYYNYSQIIHDCVDTNISYSNFLISDILPGFFDDALNVGAIISENTKDEYC